MRRALRYVSLLLLPALVPKSVSGVSRSRPNAGAVVDLRGTEPALLPYLAAVGPPPLRFQTQPPPPDLTGRPAAGAPPIPAKALTENPGETPKPRYAEAEPASATAPDESKAVAANDKVAPAPSPNKAPTPSIIPDDMRPSVRPEDFLPYFQIPGAKPGDPSLLVPVPVRGAPAPAPLPPSSATYTQSK
jgi:hypothetical protein